MESTRRQFFGRAVTAAVAATVAELPTAPAIALPVVAELGWTWLRVSGFRPDLNTTGLVCQIAARRTDGGYFYVQWIIPREEFLPDEINATLRDAFDTLETFRTCECRVGIYCPLHEHMAPSIQEDDDV